MVNHEINPDFCFKTSKEVDIKVLHEAFERYSTGFEAALNLEGDTPIILDTNVLLSYYSISQKEKDKFIKFLEENQNRFYMTSQIESEFLRNRERKIRQGFFDPLSKIQTDFESTYKSLKTKFGSFINENKQLLSVDYVELWELLQKKKQELDTILSDQDEISQKIKLAVDTATESYSNIYISDSLLKACSKLNRVPSLTEIEIEFIQELYEELWQIYEDTTDKELKRKYVFPGLGDKRNKKDDPYGDFIIFHEILKFMKTGIKQIGDEASIQSTDVIFLTLEKEKSDWINKDLSPITEYIIKTYLETRQTLFILHADKPLQLTFQNIYQEHSKPEENSFVRESTVVNLNYKGRFGFLYSKLGRSGNLYFNASLMKDPKSFDDLGFDDVVQYKVAKNEEGEEIATDVQKVEYSFEGKEANVFKSKISGIKKDKGFGFVLNFPNDIYFHHKFMDESTDFDDLNEGDEVECLVGKDELGESMVRLLRKTSNDCQQSESEIAIQGN